MRQQTRKGLELPRQAAGCVQGKRAGNPLSAGCSHGQVPAGSGTAGRRGSYSDAAARIRPFPGVEAHLCPCEIQSLQAAGGGRNGVLKNLSSL